MTATTRWWWIRHAPVPSGGKLYGQCDLAADCSELPVFRSLSEWLPEQAVWLETPLQRTRQTSLAIREHWPADKGAGIVPGIEADLIEQSFGDWQGMTYAELDRSRDGAWHRFWLMPASTAAPGGESFVDLYERVSAAILRLTAAHKGQDIVAVAHGGTIRAALGLALGLEPEAALALNVDNCSLTRLDHIEGPRWKDAEPDHATESWRIVRVNQVAGKP